MVWNKRSFALELILRLYKEEKINFIEAVKLIRGVFNVGLYDAKKLMDMVRDHLPTPRKDK